MEKYFIFYPERREKIVDIFYSFGKQKMKLSSVCVNNMFTFLFDIFTNQTNQSISESFGISVIISVEDIFCV